MTIRASLQRLRRAQPLLIPTLVVAALTSLAGTAAAQSRQSPIDIEPRGAVVSPLPYIAVDYKKTDVTVVNTFNPSAVPFVPREFATVRVNVPAGSTVTVNGVVYDLVQFHFHTPSEHTVAGRHAPLEIHFVHLKHGACLGDGDALLVIGARIEGGLLRPSELDRVFAGALPTDNTVPATTVSALDLSKLLPARWHSWRYLGSLTAPSNVGCGNPAGDVATQLSSDVFPENVSWVVLHDVLRLRSDSIQKFRAVFPGEGNSRPVQPLDGRAVYTDRH